ncbi:MAG: tripartite tricarboxylate transporter substrate binding protein [Betaproteobacteria bacterium]|jgi:tripartite-type tricarboxylate transporter receptor subunit TctC|nr:tripartite tricarboxylate transporter substrate binding protein [Betaproteobacteria bacterium]
MNDSAGPSGLARMPARAGRLAAVLLAGAAMAATVPARAQPSPSGAWPAKPMRLVIPFAPGGTTDNIGRLVAQRLAEPLGQPVVVDNRPGAGGMIGADMVAKAPPDGYTMLMMTIAFPINAGMRKDLPFDPIRSFAPVTQLVSLPLMLVVHPSVPVKSVKELAALARARPGQLTYATSGHGTSPHMAAAMFTWMTKTEMIHVPYKGNAPTLVDLLGGQVSMTFGIAHQFLPHVKSGKLRALAVTTAKRTGFAPQLPTIAEAGLDGYEISAWQGILAPAGTPKEITTRLSSEIARILRQPDVVERLVAEGAEPVASAPDAFGEYLRAELARWSRVGREAGIRIE